MHLSVSHYIALYSAGSFACNRNRSIRIEEIKIRVRTQRTRNERPKNSDLLKISRTFLVDSHPKYRQALQAKFPVLVCGKEEDDTKSTVSGVSSVPAQEEKVSA